MSPYQTRFRAGVLLILMAMAPSLAAVESRWVYYWTDVRGVDHFSDIPVDGARKIRVPSRVPRDASAEEAGRAALAGQDDGSGLFEAVSPECEQKRAALREYESPDYKVIETDALGNERVYTERERQQLIELTRTQADEACGR